jgi:hypothetical protein
MACPTGASTSAVTLINSAADLSAMKSNKYYKLAKDIAITGAYVPASAVTNIVFDGDGHTISNVNGQQGLFSSAGNSLFYNVNIKAIKLDIITTSATSVGALAGTFSGPVCVDKVTAQGTMKSTNLGATRYIGGLLGSSNAPVGSSSVYIYNSFSNVSLLFDKGYQTAVGGFIGYSGNTALAFKDSNYSGSIRGRTIGGFVGYSENSISVDNASIYDSKIQGQVTSDDTGFGYIGGVVGRFQTAGDFSFTNSKIQNTSIEDALTDSYYVGGVISNVETTAKILFSKNTIELSMISSNPRLGSSYGGLIGNVERCTSLDVTDQTQNVNMQGGLSSAGGLMGRVYNCPTVNIKRVNASVKIAGDGSELSGSWGGLIGQSSTSSVAIEDSTVTGSITQTPLKWSSTKVCGGAIGSFGNTMILSIKKLNTNVAVSCPTYVGGILGMYHNTNGSGLFQDSKASGPLQGGIAGGLAADLSGGNTSFNIVRSSATSSVSGCTAGGLVGAATLMLSIDSSYAVGTIDGCDPGNIGGLVGRISGYGTTNYSSSINNSYSLSDTNKGTYTGGLIGSGHSLVQIGKSFAKGKISPGTGGTVGGICPASCPPVTNVTSTYWDTQTSGTSVSNVGTGRTTSSMTTDKAAYSGWDFVNTWQWNAGSYPSLRNNP